MKINEYFNSNKIIAVVGNSGSGKTTFINNFEFSKKVGIINYNIIKSDTVNNQIEYYVRKYNYRLNSLNERKNEIVKMLDINENILDKDVFDISESELIKTMIASVLLYNPEVIILDEVLSSFDYKNKEKIFKLFLKLKKFFKKTIVLVTSNIDDVYEYIDDVIVIDEGKVLLYGNKYDVYNNYDLLVSKNIRIPNIVKFIKKLKDKNIILDNVDSINELIKTMYREMR